VVSGYVEYLPESVTPLRQRMRCIEVTGSGLTKYSGMNWL